MDRLAPRLFLLVVGLLFATLLVVLALADRASRSQALVEAHERLQAAHGVFREQLQQRRLAQRQLTDAVSNDFGLKEEIAIAEPGSVSLEVTLRNFQRRGGAAWAVATDPAGRILASTIEELPAGTALSFRDVFDASGGSETLRRVEALLHQVIATPVHAPRPLVVGWLVFGFPLDDAKMANLEEQTRTVFSLVDGTAGDLQVLASGLAPEARAALAARFTGRQGFAQIDLTGRGEDVVLAMPLDTPGGRPVHVVLQKSLSAALEGFRQLRLQLAGTALVALLLAAGAAWWLSRRISRPLSDMAKLAHRLGEGQFDTVLPAKAAGEVGVLARALTVMQQGLRERDEALRAVAYVSTLTGLPNRTAFVDALRQTLTTTPHVGVIVVDLDHFADINDTLGHAIGDRVIGEMAGRLVRAMGASASIAHFGGDQFALAVEARSAAALESAAASMASAFREPADVEGLALHLTGTAGAALAPLHGDSAEALLRHAESAMYRGKERRGSGLTLYDPAHDHHSRQRLALMGELPGAIERGELHLHVQPKASLTGREVVGVECLVRWVHPVLGMIAPDRFIPLAEQTGQIRHLTRWLLDTTAREMRLAEERGFVLRWAVNISAVDLLSPDFAHKVGEVLRTHGLAPDRLTVEVTESAAMSDPENAIRQLAALRHMGVKLSIDDYGTGHASMAQLKRLPVDELKIDRSFVRSLMTDTNDQAIVASTIALAHRLGLSVVAEGVEDRATAGLLAAMGCDEIQGFGLARPMPVDVLVGWLESQAAAVRDFTAGPAV
jgi:diguanylate cyclase (GGDEF)-like protein